MALQMSEEFMQMKTLEVDVPDIAFSTMRMDLKEMANEMRNAAVVKWYELGRISQGRGAEIAGISRSKFLDLLSKYGVCPFQYTEQEIENEFY